MTSDEIAVVGRLGGRAAAGIAAHVEELHHAIADRSFGPTGAAGAGVRAVHDGIAGPIYAITKVVLRGAGAVTGSVVGAAVAPAGGAPMGRSAPSNQALAALNAVVGDRFHEERDPLAIRMALRSHGIDVEPDTASLATAFPAPTSKLALFVHGLGETEVAWRRGAGRDGDTYGSQLADELGYTPVFLRYNTGRHVSDNGQELSQLLSRVLGAWPVPVTELLVVGHSMGGLVIRAACHHGAEASAPWVPLLRDAVYLGSPHTGAIAARGARTLSWALAKVPETRGYASLLDHSPGIRDLRFGYVLEADWLDCDAGACREDHGNEVPLLPTANHFVVSATLLGDEDSPPGRAIGDLLVTPASAHGRHRRRPHLTFREGVNGAGLHHFHLLNDPRIYQCMQRWLSEPSLPDPVGQEAVGAGARR